MCSSNTPESLRCIQLRGSDPVTPGISEINLANQRCYIEDPPSNGRSSKSCLINELKGARRKLLTRHVALGL